MHISIGEENVGIECGVHTHTHTCTVAKRRDGRPTCVRAEFPGRCSAEKRRDGEAEQDGIGMAPCKTYGEAGCNADRLEATAQSLSNGSCGEEEGLGIRITASSHQSCRSIRPSSAATGTIRERVPRGRIQTQAKPHIRPQKAVMCSPLHTSGSDLQTLSSSRREGGEEEWSGG